MEIKSVAIILYPNVSDNWAATPLFGSLSIGTTAGYILASTPNLAAGFVDYTLATDRLIKFGAIHNRVDFMQITSSEREGQNKSNGIGGLSKLKDFNFTLTDRNDLTESRLYGRIVEVRVYSGNSLTNDADGLYLTKFKGEIVESTSVKNVSITFKAQGQFANSNPRISGEPFINPDGDIDYTPIFLGQSSNLSFVPLGKVRGASGIQLHYDDTKYKLDKVYIKDKDVDEFYPVDTPFVTENGSVIFENSRRLLLAEDIDNRQAKLRLNDGVDFLIQIDLDAVDMEYFDYIIVNYPYATLDKWFTLKKLRTFTEDGVEFGIYRGAVKVAYPEHFTNLRSNVQSLTAGYTIRGSDFPTPSIASKVIGANLLAWTIFEDAGLKFPRFTTSWFDQDDPNSLLFLGARGTRRQFGAGFSGSNKTVFNPVAAILPVDGEKAQVRIKIGDEEMLVLYADDEMIVRYENGDLINNLGFRECYIVRGFNGTDREAHSAGDEITVFGDDSSYSPIVSIYKTLKQLLQQDAVLSNSNNYNAWAEGNEDATYAWKIFLDINEARDYLFLNFGLPDLNGILVEAFIDSKIESRVTGGTFPYHMMVGLSVTEHPDVNKIDRTVASADAYLYSRQIYGINWLALEDNTHHINAESYDGVTTITTKTLYRANDVYDDRGKTDLFIPFLYHSYNTYTGGVITVDEEKYAKHFLKGGWHIKDSNGADQYIQTYYRKKLADDASSDFNLLKYEDLRENYFALVALFPYKNEENAYVYTTLNINMAVTVKVRTPIADNDFFGNMISLSGDEQGSELIQTISSIGANASISLYTAGVNTYLFLESDTLPLSVYSLSGTGLLTLVQAIPLAGYETVADGSLVRLNDGRIAKLAKTLTNFLWIQTVDIALPNFPEIELRINTGTTIGATDIGETIVDAGYYFIVIDGTDLKVWKKGETQDGNPVTVLKTLLTTYAGYENADIDDNVANPSDQTTSFGLVRLARQRDKSTFTLTQEVNANNVINIFLKNFGLILYENDIGLLALADLNPPNESTVTTELNASNIYFTSKFLPEVKIKYLNKKYIITNLDVRYSPVGDKFQKEILSEDLDAEHSDYLDIAREYCNSDSEVAFEHLSTYDRQTALRNALTKLIFHHKPTRILTIKVSESLSIQPMGSWISINADTNINNVNGKIYLVVGKKLVLPVGTMPSYVEFELYEYDWDLDNFNIQEVPLETINENYQEVHTNVDVIQEVDNNGN